MITVTFHEKQEIPDEALKFSVIAAQYQGQWIFCRHKKRSTWEIPGGHREPGETTYEAAKRELQEETGAAEFDLQEVCVYAVAQDGQITCGMLCHAQISSLGPLPPEMEIGQIRLCDHLPPELTYPAIQPHLFAHVQQWLSQNT